MVRFPYSQPLPKEFIQKIAGFCVKDERVNNALWMKSWEHQKNLYKEKINTH